MNGDIRGNSFVRQQRVRRGAPSFTTTVFFLVGFLVVLTWLIAQRSLQHLNQTQYSVPDPSFPTDSHPDQLLQGPAAGEVVHAVDVNATLGGPAGGGSAAAPKDDANIELDAGQVKKVVQQIKEEQQQSQGTDALGSSKAAPGRAAVNEQKDAESLSGMYGQEAGTVVFPAHSSTSDCPKGVASPQSAMAAIVVSVTAGSPLEQFVDQINSLLQLYGTAGPDLRGNFHLFIALDGHDPLLHKAASRYAYDTLGMVKLVQFAAPSLAGTPSSSSNSSSSHGGVQPNGSAPGQSHQQRHLSFWAAAARRLKAGMRQLASTEAAAAAGAVGGAAAAAPAAGGEELGSGAHSQAEHQRYMMHVVLDCFQYPGVIFLDPDMALAPDFFGYFAATQWLPGADASLYCISAWNDLGQNQAAASALSLLRTDYHPGRAWYISQDVGRELLQLWAAAAAAAAKPHLPSVSAVMRKVRGALAGQPQQPLIHGAAGALGPHLDASMEEWVRFLRRPEVRRGRQCIIPEKPRAEFKAPVHPDAAPEPDPPSTAAAFEAAAAAAANSSSSSGDGGNHAEAGSTDAAGRDDGAAGAGGADGSSSDSDAAGGSDGSSKDHLIDEEPQQGPLGVGGEVLEEEEVEDDDDDEEEAWGESSHSGRGEDDARHAGQEPPSADATGGPAGNSSSSGTGLGDGAGASSSSSRGGGNGVAPSPGLLRWMDRDLSTLLTGEYQHYVMKLLKRSQVAGLTPATKVRKGLVKVWYDSLAEYAAAVKLLGVGGASWEATHYCYHLPQVHGVPSARGSEHCQEFLPVTAYEGITILRNTHGARVLLVPAIYRDILEPGSHGKAPRLRHPGLLHQETQASHQAAAATAAKRAAAAAKRQQEQKAAEAAREAAAKKAKAWIKGNATAANQVIREMLKHHKDIEQHGGVA